MSLSVHTTSTATPFASSIPCTAMIFPPLFQFAGAWRHPGNRTDWLRAGFWSDMGQQLEVDGYDMLFIPDAMAMARGYDGTTDATISTGAKGGIYLDPVTVMATVAAVTSSLRLGCTISTSFIPAYDIARRMATLHQLSNGRAAWNIVTSAYEYEAINMGLPGLEPKEQRYQTADRVTREVLDIWASFPQEALLADTETGRFADAASIRPTAAGIGPLMLPGDVVGHRPMLLQAGASSTGLEFAARWADATFMVAADTAQARGIRTDLRSRAARAGRNPDDITTLMGVQPIVGETDVEAQAKLQQQKELIDPMIAWQDLATLFRANPKDWDLADSAADFLNAQRGATAQEMRTMVAQGATDGFMIMGTVVPGSFTSFAPVIACLNARV